MEDVKFGNQTKNYTYCSKTNNFCVYLKIYEHNIVELTGKGSVKKYKNHTIEFLETVFHKEFKDEKIYIIHNLKDYADTDPTSRIKYLNWLLKNKEKFLGIYFVNVNFLQEVQILSAKFLVTSISELKIFKNTEDAIHHIKKINKTLAVENLHLDKIHIDVKQNPNYKILQFNGYINSENKTNLISTLQRVLYSNELDSKNIIIDFSKISGNPFIYHKSVFLSKKYKNNYKYYIVVDKYKYTKIRIWASKNYPEYNFTFAISVDEAINFIENEDNFTEKKYLINDFKHNKEDFKSITANYFNINLPERKIFNTEILNNKVISGKFNGNIRFKKLDLILISRHIDNLIENENITKPVWLFLDFKNLKEITIKARKELVDWFLMQSNIFEKVIIYNTSKTLFFVSNFIKDILKDRVDIVITDNFYSALDIFINKDSGTISNKNFEKNNINSKDNLLNYIKELEKQNEQLIEERKKNIDKLFTLMGNISWNENYKFTAEAYENSPYYRLYGAIEMLNKDIIHTLKIRDALISKALESEKLKSSFLSNLSHEIRTPLNGIIGFSSFLKEKEDLPKDIYRYLSIIEQSGTNLLAIIDNIMDISKLETNQYALTYKNISVNELMHDIYRLFAGDAKDKYLDLKMVIPEYELTLNTDRTALFKIIKNLLSNAIKFTSQGYIEFGYKIENKRIKIYVKDTGIGIDKDKTENIFENFRQSAESTKREYGGLGLGLSVSQGIAKLLGTKIKVKSEINKGSYFYFELPQNITVMNYI